MAEIVPVVSEALEAQVRDLLPSQRGFGEDLQASNVITPIIDLTAAAQGTTTPESLQQAMSFGGITYNSIINNTVALVSTPGFWRFRGNVGFGTTAGAAAAQLKITDGLTTKNLINFFAPGVANNYAISEYDFIVFLRSGDSVSGVSPNASIQINNVYNQVADVNGNLVNPVGFTPQ